MSPSRAQALIYGLPGAPLALMGLPLAVFLPTAYAEHTGLGLATIGVVILAARLWDMVSDPLAGMIGDRVRLPFGRRKAMILLGAPLLLVGGSFLFNPPADAGVPWLLGWSLVVYTGWTLVVLPYSAWGAELSDDYHERSLLTGAREGFVIIGTLGALMLSALAGEGEPAAGTLALIGVALWVTLPPALALPLWRLPESRRFRKGPNWRKGLRMMGGNRPFLRLIVAYLLNGTANALPATLFILFVTHVLESPQWIPALLALYFAAGVVGLPLWLRLAGRFGKHRSWAVSMIWACAVFIWVPLLGADDVWLFLIICLLSGLSLGVDMALPASIQADVVDLDRAMGGGERAGLFFGVWGMATKLALALAVGLAFPLLALAGFDPDAAAPDPLWALSLLYGALPIPFKLAAVALVWRFPLDRSALQSIQRRPSDDTKKLARGTGAAGAPVGMLDHAT
ncbi:MAG: MFS transporter [Chromatiales bacterium]|jgi:Na+/melibiose symporter-like transporter